MLCGLRTLSTSRNDILSYEKIKYFFKHQPHDHTLLSKKLQYKNKQKIPPTLLTSPQSQNLSQTPNIPSTTLPTYLLPFHSAILPLNSRILSLSHPNSLSLELKRQSKKLYIISFNFTNFESLAYKSISNVHRPLNKILGYFYFDFVFYF